MESSSTSGSDDGFQVLAYFQYVQMHFRYVHKPSGTDVQSQGTWEYGTMMKTTVIMGMCRIFCSTHGQTKMSASWMLRL